MADAVQVGTLFALLKLDKSPFEKGVSDSGGLFGKLAGFALKGAAIVSTAVLGIGIASAKNADEQERADLRVRNALGSSADAFNKWASKNAVALRQTDDALQNYGAQSVTTFKNLGFTMADSVGMTQKLMARAADISAETGKSFEEVFGALLKGTGGATKGLKGLGIVLDTNAIQAEALRLGVWDGKGAMDAGAKAAAIYSLELSKSAQSAGAAAERSGSMGETMKTIPVLFDKIMDALGRIFLPLLNAILPSVTAAFGQLADWVEANADSIADSLGFVIDLIGKGFSFVATEVIPRLGAAFDWIVKNIIPPLAAAFSFLVDEVFPALMGGAEETGAAIGPAIGDAIGVLVNDVLPVLAAAFQTFIDDVLPSLVAAFQFIVDEVIPALAGAFSWIADELLPPLMAAFTAIAENIMPILAAAFDTVVAVVRDNWPTISSIAESVGGVVKGVVEVISAVIQAAAPIIRWLAETIFPILGAAAGILLGAIDVAFKAIKVIFDALLAAGKFVVDGLSAAFNGLVGIFKFVGDTISSVFRNALNFLIGIANGVIAAVNGIQIHIGRIGLDTPAGFIGVGPFDWNGLQIPNLRYLERGGIVTSPTLAMIGEKNRAEAVIPLDDPRVRDLFGRGNGRTMNNYLTVQGDLRAPTEESVLTTLQRMAEVGG